MSGEKQHIFLSWVMLRNKKMSVGKASMLLNRWINICRVHKLANKMNQGKQND